MDTDMVAFVRARLAEHEREARVFDWAQRNHYEVTAPEASPEYVTVYMPPNLLLADVEFKQQILDLYEANPSADLDAVVRRLALLFHDHPDYRSTWGLQPPPGRATP